MGGKYIHPQFCQRKSRREQLLPVTYSWDVTTIDCDMPLRKYLVWIIGNISVCFATGYNV